MEPASNAYYQFFEPSVIKKEKKKNHFSTDNIRLLNWSDKTILIAEDEETNFLYLKTALIKTNITILRAKNGIEAVDISRTRPDIDVILMDIKMPKMNGIEATQAIKSFRSDVKIIAQTAFAMEEDKSNCIAVGCDDFMAKPIKLDSLIGTISNHLK
jgi:CheY-like chemotaxis protein